MYNITTTKANDISFKANPWPKITLKNQKTKLLGAKTIDIFCHASPDEDTLNSAIVMYRWLVSKGKKVRIFAAGNLKGLFGVISDKKIDILDPNESKRMVKADLALVLDCNSLSRVPLGAKERLRKYKEAEIIVMDHHKPKADEIILGNGDPNSASPCYIDSSATSCSSIVYRFFEGLKKPLNNENLTNIYCGMLSDLNKSNLIKITNTNGVNILKRTPELQNHTTAVEILDDIENKLYVNEKSRILKHLNILYNLSGEEKAFQKKLFAEKIQVTPNGKLAYVIIGPQDRAWLKLGQDNTVTSTILNDMRKRVLANNPDDELIPSHLKDKLNDLKGVMVFYRGEKCLDPSKEVYRMSIHSNDNYAEKLIDYIKKHLRPDIQDGGQPNRSGGRIYSTEPENCLKYVDEYLQAAKFVT